VRCYFDRFENLVEEANSFILDKVVTDPLLQSLPVFLLGLSMGGATAVRMALAKPGAYRGVVLYAPMLSLRLVKQQPVFLCIRNAHLEPVSGCLSALFPTLPIAKPALNVHNPLSQKEMDDDPLTYSADCRARVAREFIDVRSALG
jgi:alpha-beta hydrolase superfamily lysophospholipase